MSMVSGRWEPLRIAVMAICALGIVLATTGLVADHLFAQPTTAKYYMTVLVPAVGALTCLSARPLRVLVAAAIVLGPFAMTSTLRDVTLSPLGILLAAAAIVAAYQRRPAVRLTSTSLVVALVLALLAPAVLLGAGQSHYVVWLAGTFVAGWLAFVLATEPGGARYVVSWVVVAGAVQAVLAVFESTRGVQLALHSQGGEAAATTFAFGDNYFRPEGALPDPISLGNVLAFVLPLGVGLAATALKRREGVAWTLATGLIALGLLLTYSRLSWVGGTLGVAVAVLAMPPRIRFVSAVTALAGLLVIVLLGLTVAGPTVRERFSSIADPTATTNRTFKGDREREQIWSSSLDVFRAQPATGIGFGKLQPALGEHLAGSPAGLHAHSLYFQILASAGIAGAVALFLLIAQLARTIGTGLRRDRAVHAAYLGALVAMLLPWLTDTTARFAQVTVFYAFTFGAMLAARAVGRRAEARVPVR
ncbi:MAG: putative rane protein of ExoQ family, partial [Conexibacter sp.]|nr:putative rane protein of ExoQ family [Conexibacter sp.]